MKTSKRPLPVILALVFLLTGPSGSAQDTLDKPVLNTPYLSITSTDTVVALLATDFKNSVMPAVKRLEGNIAYYVAQDRKTHAITNVSIWESEEAALQMNRMKEMAEMRGIFLDLGLKFVPITNHKMVWKLPEQGIQV